MRFGGPKPNAPGIRCTHSRPRLFQAKGASPTCPASLPSQRKAKGGRAAEYLKPIVRHPAPLESVAAE